MREIKFRAWNCVRKCYIYNVEHEYDDDLCCFSDALDDSGLIAEQYTGVNDTNGREIYEGDIIRFQLFATAQGIVGDIRYNSRYGYCVFFYNGVKTMWRQEYWTDYKALQVVGNIHEDPELLEGDNDD
ncbi:MULTISPECIES: YopX family protein [Levilactobacillus]|uniref:YopX family protein n=1 Tax=Levilactobacillus tangyuanensis TaxID=2486021 RepID=A0ABW1TR71_9LACO|nr:MULTISPECIES: YopX family protein [Levilactobacillus]